MISPPVSFRDHQLTFQPMSSPLRHSVSSTLQCKASSPIPAALPAYTYPHLSAAINDSCFSMASQPPPHSPVLYNQLTTYLLQAKELELHRAKQIHHHMELQKLKNLQELKAAKTILQQNSSQQVSFQAQPRLPVSLPPTPQGIMAQTRGLVPTPGLAPPTSTVRPVPTMVNPGHPLPKQLSPPPAMEACDNGAPWWSIEATTAPACLTSGQMSGLPSTPPGLGPIPTFNAGFLGQGKY